MILQKIAHRVTTSLGLVTQHPEKYRTWSFSERVTSVRNSNCESNQGGSPLQKLAKRPAPQPALAEPTLAMKLNIALVERKTNKIAEWARQIEALPDWSSKPRRFRTGPPIARRQAPHSIDPIRQTRNGSNALPPNRRLPCIAIPR
jgi:hypothetical protein